MFILEIKPYSMKHIYQLLICLFLLSGAIQLTGQNGNCPDLAGVDFGDCEAAIGFTLVNGECGYISGCSMIATDGTDYSDYFYNDYFLCVTSCISDPNVCVDSSLIDLTAPCTFELAPVCGCDGVTYSNPCLAVVQGGVTSYTGGPCLNACNTTGTPSIAPWIANLNMDHHELTQGAYNGNIAYYYVICDPAVDGVNVLFDCEGNQICTSVGLNGIPFEDCTDFDPDAFWGTLVIPCGYTSTTCTYNNPVTDLPFIQTVIDDYTSNACNCNYRLYTVDYGGVEAFLLDTDCNFIDDPDVLYDCQGNILCLGNGETGPPYCHNEYTILDTLWTCFNGVVNPVECNEDWIADLNMTSYHLIKYYNSDIGGFIYLKENCDPLLQDAQSTIYDCYGNVICQGEPYGLMGCDFTPNPFDGTIIVPCSEPSCVYAHPINDLPAIDSLINQLASQPDCGCASSLSMVDYQGVTTFFLDSDCNFVDIPDVMFDCEGNSICAIDGEILPPYCTYDFTVIDTLWTCEDGIVYPETNNMIPMELSLRVFLEGPMNTNNGLMTPALSQNNLLTDHPYNQAPYNYAGPALTGEVPPYAVDYVLIQLKEDFGMAPFAEQVAFVLQNGFIVLEDGSIPEFMVNASTTYQVWIRHHNHIDIVSSVEIQPANTVQYYFQEVSDALGPQQLKEGYPNRPMMFVGDINHDGVVNSTDYDNWYQSPAVLNQYLSTDLTLDGVTQATDYDAWFKNKAKVGYAESLD